MDKSENCASCGKPLIKAGATSFPCPSCGSVIIARCSKCREQSVLYRCKGCGFRGP